MESLNMNTENSDQKIHTFCFQLWAPYNERAALIGSFSDWQEIDMLKDELGVFQTEIALPDGEHAYQFRIVSNSFFSEGKWMTLSDPFARQVDENNRYNAILRLKNGRQITDEYVWQHDDVPLPSPEQQVIYEMHVAGFGGGGFLAAARRLDYLQELGVNCVQLMPIAEYPGTDDWGYTTLHSFAPESSYGRPEELKFLVDQCHARGISVILDLILNHTHPDHPLTRIDYEYWFYRPGTEPDERHDIWGPKFNLSVCDRKFRYCPARQYLFQLAEYWVREYHFDGYRIDAARQIRHFDFLAEVARRVKTIAAPKPFYFVAEHVPENPAIVSAGPADGAYHETYYWAIDTLLIHDTFSPDRLAAAIDPPHHGYPGAAGAVNFTENHDKIRLLQRLRDLTELDEATCFRCLHAAASLLLTSVGVPLLYQGQELAQSYPRDEAVHPIDWSLRQVPASARLFEHYRRLIALRNQTPALTSEQCDFLDNCAARRVLTYLRGKPTEAPVLVVAHLGAGELQDYRVCGLPETGSWREWPHSTPHGFDDDAPGLDLSSWQVRIFLG